MKHRIITVSREFGSGGRTIAKEVAEKLRIPCYDQELIEKVAEESGFAKEYIAEHGEQTGNWLTNAFAAAASYYGPIGRDFVWMAQRKVILELAEKHPCVIVGRCADFILRDRADLLKVFIHADPAFRADRIVRVYGEREDSPEKRIRDKDKRRMAYYRYYTDIDWGVAKNYDVCLDSGTIGIDRCVDIIFSLFLAAGMTFRLRRKGSGGRANFPARPSFAAFSPYFHENPAQFACFFGAGMIYY